MTGTEDDERLARRAAAGDGDAVSALLEAYYDRIHRFAWRWCGSREAAEDVAQEVCIRIATGIRAFAGGSTLATWVWRITYHAAVDHLRAARRTRPLAPAAMTTLVDGASDVTPETAALDADLWSLVRALPGQQRDAVLLVYAEDMSHAEAGRIMGCTEKTVSWHLHEARKTLRQKLDAAEAQA
jgi:RNA polymerase sigma-70 factor (ECF subfamily)